MHIVPSYVIDFYASVFKVGIHARFKGLTNMLCNIIFQHLLLNCTGGKNLESSLLSVM